MVPGVAGAAESTDTANDAAELLPQALFAVTVTFPAVLPHVTVIEVEPWPAVIEAPGGTVQLYEAAPLTAEIVYVTPTAPAQTVAPLGLACVIVPGVAGTTFTVSAFRFEVVVQGPLLFSVTTQS